MPDLAHLGTPQEQKDFNDRWQALQALLASPLSPPGRAAAMDHFFQLNQLLNKWRKSLPAQDPEKKHLARDIGSVAAQLNDAFRETQRRWLVPNVTRARSAEKA